MQPNSTSKAPVRVVGINGSRRPGSFTHMAVALALEGAQEIGAQTQLIDLRDYDLPLSEGKTGECNLPDVLRLRHEVQQAQGIILGTPEYHGSFSGVLKNALDLMGFEEFEGKMLGLVGVSGGTLGASNALSSLQFVGRALHAWTVPEHASVPQAWKVFDAQGRLMVPELESRVKNVGRQVARFAYLHHSAQAKEFLRVWETAPANPGGGEEVIE